MCISVYMCMYSHVNMCLYVVGHFSNLPGQKCGDGHGSLVCGSSGVGLLHNPSQISCGVCIISFISGLKSEQEYKMFVKNK